MNDVEKFFKRIDQSKIFPPFLKRSKQLVLNCVQGQANKSYHAISGFRDPVEQDGLYSIGRTTQLDRAIVTNAKGFKSYHNYGLAIDFCWDRDAKREGLQPGWEPEQYKALAEEAEKLDLLCGGKFTNPDWPHIQLPMNVLGLTRLEELYKNKGLEACWEEVERIMRSTDRFKFWF